MYRGAKIAKASLWTIAALAVLAGFSVAVLGTVWLLTTYPILIAVIGLIGLVALIFLIAYASID